MIRGADASVAHVRICGGEGRQLSRLPDYLFLAGNAIHRLLEIQFLEAMHGRQEDLEKRTKGFQGRSMKIRRVQSAHGGLDGSPAYA